jgi:hypothetical protein
MPQGIYILQGSEINNLSLLCLLLHKTEVCYIALLDNAVAELYYSYFRYISQSVVFVTTQDWATLGYLFQQVMGPAITV